MGIGVSVSLTSIQLGQHLVNLDHHLVFTNTKMWLWTEKQFFLAEWFQIWNLEVSWYDDAFSSRSSWPNCAVWVIDVQEIYKRNNAPTRLTNCKCSIILDVKKPTVPQARSQKGAERKEISAKAFLPIPSVRWRNAKKLEALEIDLYDEGERFLNPQPSMIRIMEHCPKVLLGLWFPQQVGLSKGLLLLGGSSQDL